MNQIVNPPDLPEPTGFSHVVASGRTVYLAGQIAAGDTLVEQFDGAARGLVTALAGAGADPEDLVWLQVFVTDVAEYRDSRAVLGRVWRKHFGRHYPAIGMFGVTELFDPEAKVELMGIAVKQA